MDDSQTAFASQYATYPFDLDMMKRSMDTVGGPDAKKARWSPPSGFSNQNGNNAGAPNRDAFANYGYGPNASINQPFNGGAANGGAFAGSPLYSTTSLSINTQANGAAMPSQLSPNTAAAAFAVQQQQQQQAQQGQGAANGAAGYAAGFGGYNMLGMGLPSMNMLGSFPYNGQMANFNQQRIPSLNLAMPAAQAGAYSPAALTAAMNASGNATGRTVYVGNLPATASVDELLNLVHFGPLESIRVLPEKSCVFLSFLDGATAAAFHADATVKKLSLHGQELKIGWGKPSPVPAQVALAISQSNASRNVYIGGLDENMTEEMLRDELSRFGLIDQVKIVRDKNIGFVHFLSISVATKVVNTLPNEPAWAGKRVNFGKDRCAYIPKSQQVAAQQAQAAAAQSLVAQQQGNGFAPFSPYVGAGFDMMGNGLAGGAGGVQAMNRTVYLGNIHPETTTEDLCNAIRGGVLQSIRYMQDKHIAFVTFVDPAAAFTFFQVASYQGMTLNNRRLKVGWGKNAGPLPPSLALAVHAGATRNVYIGNIEDFEVFNEEKLKRDFGEYGDIELVNFLKEKNCAFVNFTNISNAIKAIDGIKNKAEYANLRIAHGKDRCANPPRSGPQGGGRRTASGNAAANANEGGSGNAEDANAEYVNGAEADGEMHLDADAQPNGSASPAA
ncbi:RNA-binding protein Nrd1 [Coprinopsis cinerea okayama7|uniref:RNA-binding protein Nrd1 n=1 Tax=Coprinopsis cinerea (strain Okayama-7 / 130 / ATCC MYA-4618 / FGSC 9003) TaxID=240176 RepID=A8N6W2_COPC7|nr:RNA-binding protein Nrd1 [Coprinopsis cinerea okayama7\|eukprot:XP_001830568.1 RNA-binding protein Nrd1 [Coprinopsis cinerea okayama7\